MSDKTAASPGPAPIAKPPKRRRWLRQVLLGIVILACGVVIGGGLTIKVVWDNWVYAARHPEAMPERSASRIKKRLDLSDAQTQQVHEILTRHNRVFMEIKREALPRVKKELDELRVEIETILSNEQAAEWNERFDMMSELLLGPAAAQDMERKEK